jgi:gamma-glutamyltranspeptidase/glutathione hydrolase
MLSPAYLAERAKLFDPKRASERLTHGSPAQNPSDTVYFAVTDKWGNGISFINSTYHGFGSGLVPAGCGFALQNRGANFSLDARNPNVYAPKKRPYHTIIPSMVTRSSDCSLHTVYGVMGGFMQPQGHVQVLLNMLAFSYNPQAALDAPRVCISTSTPEQGLESSLTVSLEEGIGDGVASELQRMGHEIRIVKGWNRSKFGRGQIIRVHVEDGQTIYSAGSDLRGDGAAAPCL